MPSNHSNFLHPQILKDPKKPQAKRNFWTVDMDLLPHNALKLQNLVSYNKDNLPLDLTPYIVHGKPFRYLEEQPAHVPDNSDFIQPGLKPSKGSPDPATKSSLTPCSSAETVPYHTANPLSHPTIDPHPNTGSQFHRKSHPSVEEMVLNSVNKIQIENRDQVRPREITKDSDGSPPKKVTRCASVKPLTNMLQQGYQPSSLFQHSSKTSCLMQHVYQPNVLPQHSWQPNVLPQHSWQPNALPQHSSQSSSMFQHGSQPNSQSYHMRHHGSQANYLSQYSGTGYTISSCSAALHAYWPTVV
ncbi:forkhead activin signal transducer 3-like [Pelobates cultripes]|uniref:Forkhead activin signal transducer 3-like n=1 Tax=Pelobates cultripes TaxID=61616 RepID=A0AAD1S4T4_PELCU|nr:forkhead activin signal transducer 3-like [Pelobates cultripes]